MGIDDTGLQTTNSISLYMALTDHNEYDPVIDATHVFSLNENSAFGTNVGSQMVCQSLYECYADTIEYEPLLTARSINRARYIFFTTAPNLIYRQSRFIFLQLNIICFLKIQYRIRFLWKMTNLKLIIFTSLQPEAASSKISIIYSKHIFDGRESLQRLFLISLL